MKQLRSQGVGTKKKQAEPTLASEEEILWEKGLLGDKSPQSLLDTMVRMCGLYFALRSGQEHSSLRPGQIELVEVPGKTPFPNMKLGREMKLCDPTDINNLFLGKQQQTTSSNTL